MYKWPDGFIHTLTNRRLEAIIERYVNSVKKHWRKLQVFGIKKLKIKMLGKKWFSEACWKNKEQYIWNFTW